LVPQESAFFILTSPRAIPRDSEQHNSILSLSAEGFSFPCSIFSRAEIFPCLLHFLALVSPPVRFDSASQGLSFFALPLVSCTESCSPAWYRTVPALVLVLRVSSPIRVARHRFYAVLCASVVFPAVLYAPVIFEFFRLCESQYYF
jgi:hypothetical protein